MYYNTNPKNQPTQSISREPFVGITLQQYAEAKKLPEDFLKSLEVYERRKSEFSRVHIPYFDKYGQRTGVKIYQSLNDSTRSIWQKGSHITPYGLWRTDQPLRDCNGNGGSNNKIILVEGESNAQTLWFYGYRAFGVPGATAWKPEWDEHLAGYEVFVWQEPDDGGKHFVERVGANLENIKILYPPENRKDISECHIAGDDIPELISCLLESAVPFSKIQDEKNRKELEKLSEIADSFREIDILKEVVDYCRKSGIVGEENNIRLIYVVLTSRVLDSPISLAIKGPSSVGKSYILKKVLALFPLSAYFDISSMSDKALFYTEETFERRFLIICEDVGLSSEFVSYLIRILLSEGQIKHMTVESTEHGNQGKFLEKKGPTGFITTTTKIQLHPENETRLLSIDISDDPDQTKQIIIKIAENSMGSGEITPVPEEFIDYQLWLEKLGNKKVVIPYARILAEGTKPSAVRLRRDFSVVLNVIRVIAIIYQQQRQVDANGCIIATLDDYDLTYDLLSKRINEGAESSIKPIIRETVTAVEKLFNSDDSGLVSSMIDKNGDRRVYIDNKTLADALGLDPSPTSRRVRQAIKLGFLENLETQRGKRSKIVLGKPIPDDDSILPTPNELKLLWDGQLESSAIAQHPTVNKEDKNE